MKKTVGICLLASFFVLYTFGLYLLWKPKEEPLQKAKRMPYESEIAYEEGAPTEDLLMESTLKESMLKESTLKESMNIQQPYVFLVSEQDGVLVVYEADGETVLFETNVRVQNLDAELQEKVKEGLPFVNEHDLYDFLESYSS